VTRARYKVTLAVAVAVSMLLLYLGMWLAVRDMTSRGMAVGVAGLWMAFLLGRVDGAAETLAEQQEVSRG
jgi:hypothetical protein